MLADSSCEVDMLLYCSRLKVVLLTCLMKLFRIVIPHSEGKAGWQLVRMTGDVGRLCRVERR